MAPGPPSSAPIPNGPGERLEPDEIVHFASVLSIRRSVFFFFFFFFYSALYTSIATGQ